MLGFFHPYDIKFKAFEMYFNIKFKLFLEFQYFLMLKIFCVLKTLLWFTQ